jgi:hypothetical protein
MTVRPLGVALAAVAALSLAACGGDPAATASGDGSSSSSSSGIDAKTKQAELNFAKCMRQHGIDFPDPQFGEGGRVTQKVTAKGTSPEEMKAAEQACQHFRKDVKPPQMSEEQKQQNKSQALAYSRCMREHGVEGFPDPQFSEDGGAQLKIGPDNGVNPNSPSFKAAEKACQRVQPGFGTSKSAG